MFSCHDRRNEGGYDVGKALVRSDDWRGRVVLIVGRGLKLFRRIGVVVLIRVGRQCAHPDWDAGGLKVGRVESDDADNIVVVGLQIFDSNGRLLGRYVADCGLSVLLACLPWLPTINAIDPYDVFQNGRALVGRFPV